MTIVEGEFVPDSANEIEDAMMDTAKEYFGDDLNDDQYAVIRLFYRPVAEEFAEIQEDIGLVLSSAQIDNAEDEALNLLTSLIGVPRRPAQRARGNVDFSRGSPAGKDYFIPRGTVVQTDSIEPIRFETDEESLIEGPSTDTDTTTYSTTSGSLVSQTSFTVDVSNRETVDVSSDFRTTDSTVTAYLEIADATNGVAIQNDSTTDTAFVTSGPVKYDVSSLSGDVTFEYRLRNSDGATSVELTDATVEKGGKTKSPPVEVRAVEGGEESNLGPNTLTVMPDPPNGIHSVVNPAATSGGVNREEDDDLRERAKQELSEGSSATAAALISCARAVDGVRDVTIFVNDTDTDNYYGNGLPAHSFELIVYTEDTDVQKEVGQNILDTKAAGDYSAAGINGQKVTITGDLPNGQTHDVSYSEPQPIQIYVDVDLLKTEEYMGDDEVIENVVDYLGGTFADGSDAYGLGTGEDVIYTKVQQAVMDAQGVHDINSLYIDTTSSPAGTSNILIDTFEVATGDGTDGSITVTSNDV